MGFWNEKEVKRLIQKFSFQTVLTQKPRIKHLKNIDLLHEVSFFDELNIIKKSEAFQRSY